MQHNLFLKMAIALATIFTIIAILVFITTKLKNYRFLLAQKSKKKLKILDYIFIDNNTKVVLIQNNETEHLIAISKEFATLLETNKVKNENIT